MNGIFATVEQIMSNQSSPVEKGKEQLSKIRSQPWVERAARFGYGTKGVLYIVVGALAMRVAVGLAVRSRGLTRR